MKLSELIELAEQDIKDLEDSKKSKLKENYKSKIEVFKNNAIFLKNEIDGYIGDALFSVLGSHGFIRKSNVLNHWYLEDSDISIRSQINESATEKKLTCIAQVVVKRGSLENTFNLKISHKNSEFFEFSDYYEKFSKQLSNEITIDKLNTVKKHLIKMDEHPELISSGFSRNSISKDDFELNFKGKVYTGTNENFLIILEEMLSLATCLKN
ncbi:hypothetical protein ACVS4H_001147 [Acinetobacter baumannii]|uniref:Uncharacterized protein n=1 Tax=Acinetobacter geminorum TaxID=2730922 RepID=A0ABT8ZEG9_9GAMM|nr:MULTISPECIES: hypothetical protein [Acinetobacter]MDA4925161.1 hypothetical protein [Acinetobacter baumannii]APR71604.1 hypothetical protein AHTJS_15480 [Acinetobacter haemolyticus]EXB35838.1 hypothetical protein J518_0675 [Acinetobacter baumannii 1419130]KXZ63276.1 hypothetical protein AVENLUH7437_02736 [Acinetobacter venetianus]MDO7362910.1 hypothetical protein [Acinetobacter geminorum]